MNCTWARSRANACRTAKPDLFTLDWWVRALVLGDLPALDWWARALALGDLPALDWWVRALALGDLPALDWWVRALLVGLLAALRRSWAKATDRLVWLACWLMLVAFLLAARIHPSKSPAIPVQEPRRWK